MERPVNPALGQQELGYRYGEFESFERGVWPEVQRSHCITGRLLRNTHPKGGILLTSPVTTLPQVRYRRRSVATRREDGLWASARG